MSQAKFFWSPPDNAPIVGVTKFRDVVVVATSTGVYVIVDGMWPPDGWTVHKISDAVRRNDVGE
jgi:hypothetical protein